MEKSIGNEYMLLWTHVLVNLILSAVVAFTHSDTVRTLALMGVLICSAAATETCKILFIREKTSGSRTYIFTSALLLASGAVFCVMFKVMYSLDNPVMTKIFVALFIAALMSGLNLIRSAAFSGSTTP